MSDLAEDFFEKMLDFFPSLELEYKNHIEKYHGRLDTIVIEDVFMPEIIKLLKQNSNQELLNSIFEYFEQISDSSDEYFHDIFSITVMEVLGNDRKILETAKKYMGSKTALLQREADNLLGRDI